VVQPTVWRKTKNPKLFNGLASFDAAVDCAAANNGLKRRRLDRGQGEFGFAPGLAFNIRIRSTFSTRSDELSA
jgi:hypothetical protein